MFSGSVPSDVVVANKCPVPWEHTNKEAPGLNPDRKLINSFKKMHQINSLWAFKETWQHGRQHRQVGHDSGGDDSASGFSDLLTGFQTAPVGRLQAKDPHQVLWKEKNVF